MRRTDDRTPRRRADDGRRLIESNRVALWRVDRRTNRQPSLGRSAVPRTSVINGRRQPEGERTYGLGGKKFAVAESSHELTLYVIATLPVAAF